MNPEVSFSAILRLMRPKQWIKNTFVFAPLIFAGALTQTDAIVNAVLVFGIFCLGASATYVLNDYRDIESDRKHPLKAKTRPLASGEVSKNQAKMVLVVLYGIILLSLTLLFEPTMVVIAYLLVNVAYSFYLKHQPVIDIFTIAAGFVLRVYAGAVAIDVPLSSWMFITTLSLALYLAAIKRRQELARSDEARAVLSKYTVALVDKYAEMSATCAILFYSLFVMSDRPQLVYSIPFVLFGFYRYWYVVETKDAGESPTDALFADIQLQLTIIGWVLVCSYSILAQGG